MKYKDYYKVMGLARTATQAQIKAAHRKLSRKYHPDLNKDQGAEEQFKDVAEAYQVLKDPEKRAAYDQLDAAPQGGEFRPPPGWEEGFSRGGSHSGRRAHGGASESDFSEFLDELFRSRGADHGAPFQSRPERPAAGQDQHATVIIDLEDAFTGAQRTITLQIPEIDAQGRVRMQSRTLNVSIPKGIRAGQRLRLAGQGMPGYSGGPAGDLYLEIQWREHPFYHVEDRDLTLQLPVAPWEAALGANVTVPTPSGSVSMTIPANSADGRRLRLKGRGLPGPMAAAVPGDLYIVLKVLFPKADTDAAKAAYEALRESTSFDPRAGFPG
jgi:curved DNA-binding protein